MTRLRRFERRALAATLAAALVSGCDSQGPGGPGDISGIISGDSLPGLVVSNPVTGSSVLSAAPVSTSAGGGVYASLPLGSLPNGRLITFTTRGTSDSVSAMIVEGGFDPVAIAATSDDTLDVRVDLANDTVGLALAVVVPRSRPPVVVRTNPPPRRRDVPLNTVLLLVFSEPIDSTTLTGSTVGLTLGGAPVTGTLAFRDSSHLVVTFTPDQPLVAGGQYTLLVTQAIRDLEGETLARSDTVTFTAEDPVLPSGPAPLLAYSSITDHQIYTIGMDGIGRRRLTFVGRNERPVWSPDGRRIAFVRQDNASIGDIYLMDADGSNVVRRTVNADLNWASWSPDGRKLVVSNEGLYYSDVWVMSADDDGSSPVHIATDARSPVWSPDGQRIAYVHVSNDDGYDATAVMDADGTNARDLTPNVGGRYGLTWSPDGHSLAGSVCDGACDVFALVVDGGNLSRVTDVGQAGMGAAWSPDGRWIAVTVYTNLGPNNLFSVFYVPALGGTPRLISGDALWPSWHP